MLSIMVLLPMNWILRGLLGNRREAPSWSMTMRAIYGRSIWRIVTRSNEPSLICTPHDTSIPIYIPYIHSNILRPACGIWHCCFATLNFSAYTATERLGNVSSSSCWIFISLLLRERNFVFYCSIKRGPSCELKWNFGIMERPSKVSEGTLIIDVEF